MQDVDKEQKSIGSGLMKKSKSPNTTYHEMMVEAIDLASLVKNPFARSAAGSSLFGVFKAIEKLTTEAIVKGAKFIIRNPHFAIAAYLFIDYGILDKGPMTKQLRKYFVDAFPGQAMSFYDGLAKITADNEIQPKEVIDTVTAIYNDAAGNPINESVDMFKGMKPGVFTRAAATAIPLGQNVLKAGGLAALAYAYLKAKKQLKKAQGAAENLKYELTS